MHLGQNDTMVLLARVVSVLTIAIILLNGFVMLASPRRWFRLPGWIRTQQGTLTAEEILG